MQQSFCYFQYGLGTILHRPTLVLCEFWSFARKRGYHSLFVAPLGIIIDLYLLSILCVHYDCIISPNKDYPIGELLAAIFVDIWATPCHVLGYLTSLLCFTFGGLRSTRSFHHATSFAFLWIEGSGIVIVDSILRTKPCCVNLCKVFEGVRIGEAKNPGPVNQIRFAITNPTTVVSKIDQYLHLHKKESVTVSFLSETAATRLSQKVFNAKLRAHQLKAVWSLPVPDQFQRLDGRDSLKGKATGVGFISSFPLRSAVGTISKDMHATSRIQHAILTVGPMHLQLVVVYGLPATYPNAFDINNRLLEQAIEAIQALSLPAIIGGDFNTDPMQLPAANILKSQGYSDLRHLSQAKFGLHLPPTCKDSTHPDNAICCPKVQHWITSISIYQQQIFDAHKVVIFDLNIPVDDAFRTHMPLPKSWLNLPIDENSLPSTYDTAVGRLGTPQTLENWGECVEYAVDLAYRASQQQHGQSVTYTKPLPASYRGRCKPRKIIRTPIRVLTPVSRPGDFQPEHEITTFGTLKQVVQLRRVQSLMRRVKKYENDDLLYAKYQEQLNHEWKVVCQCRSFPNGFAVWAQDQPEIGPLPQHCPSFSYLHHLEQIVRHHVQSAIASEAKIKADKRKFAQQVDAHDHGLSLSFATIKESPMPLVEALQTTVVESGILASNIEDRPLEIFVNEPSRFSQLDQILVNTTPCKLCQKTEDSLLITPLQPLEIQDTQLRLEQHQFIHNKQAIFDALTRYWLPFWQTGAQFSLQHARQFSEYLGHIPQTFPEIVVDVDSHQVWIDALSGMKSKTARGVDGFAVDELRMLPPSAIQDLRRLCTVVYANGFPDWFMVARTIALSKVHGTPAPHQVRPICILATIYRLWGKVICQQIIAQLSCHLPSQLTGFLKGRGPLQAAYQQQFDIEVAHWDRVDLSGISIDLIKCFNTIAREAGFLALERVKIPNVILNQYSNSIMALSRVWLVDDECSQIVPSSKGFPEGDGFSVIVILALSFGWIKFIESQIPTAALTAYADNWGWSLKEARFHNHVLRQTVSYAGCALMQVDWHKTWAWSTCSQHVAALKAALRSFMPDDEFQLVMNQCDLGCQMTYRGPPKLGTQRQRFLNARDRLKRLSNFKGNLPDKVRLAVGGAYSVALYGIEMLPVGTTHFDTLRSQTAEGLYGHSVSRNSAIALLCTPGLLDPQLQAIVNTLKTARIFLLKSTCDQANRFLHLASHHSGNSARCRGPAACLKYYLLKLGWTLNSAGDIHITAFKSLNLFRTSAQAIIRHAILAWQEHLLLFYTERPSIQRLPPISRVDTLQVLQKFTSSQQTTLIREIAASFQTKQQQAAWDANVTPQCEHCGQIDSRYHRVHTCSFFAEPRCEFQDTLHYYVTHDASVHELPVIHVLPDIEFNRQLHDVHPEAIIPNHVVDKLRTLSVDLLEQGQSIHVYTDGSCLHQDSPMTRYAAYSIVIDCCLTDADRCHQVALFRSTQQVPQSLQRVAAARVTGEQGIHRAEIYALVILAEALDNVVVHVDSSVALSAAQQAKVAKQVSDLAGIDDFDLALRLWNSLRHKHFSFVKVKAHIKPIDISDPLQCYHHLGNGVANDFAQDVCKHHLPHLVKQYAATHEKLFLEKQHLARLFQFLLQCSELRKKTQPLCPQQHVVQQNERVDHCKLFQEWSVADIWQPQLYQACKWECSTWGKTVMRALYQWLQHCRWPKVQVPEDTFGVSWVELATSFFIYSGMFLPVKRPIGQGTDGLIPIMTITDVATFSVKYSELVRTFVTVFQQLADLTDTLTWPKHPRGLVRSMYVLGGRTQPAGVKFRPSFYKQQEVVQLLQQYLLRTKSQTFDETPDLPFDTACIGLPQLQQELAGTWAQRQQQFHHGAAYIRRWRTQSQPGLQFQRAQ